MSLHAQAFIEEHKHLSYVPPIEQDLAPAKLELTPAANPGIVARVRQSLGFIASK